jgi:alpha-glucosidase
MYKHGRFATLLAFVFAMSSAAQTQTPVILKSPNGALELSIATVAGQNIQESGGQLAYRVHFRGKPVIDWSNLGLEIQGASVLGSDLHIEAAKRSNHDETWNSIAGKANPIRDRYNAVTVQTLETLPDARHLEIEARAYDD